MILLRAQWLCFLSNKTNLIILAFALAIFSASAIWSGLEATEYRINADKKQLEWIQTLNEEKHFIQDSNLSENEESSVAARRAFELGRTNAAPALKPALSGLALGIQQFKSLPSNIYVSILSRHLDGKQSDGDILSNPLLQGMGLPDFATILVLLIPLTIIGISYGLVQEAREQGIWRMVCAIHSAPWKILAIALFVRLIAVTIVVTVSLMLAFLCDSGSSLMVYLIFMVFVFVYCLIWILITGIFNLFQISSATSALGLLSLWIFVIYVIPSGLSFASNAIDPMPSQTQALIDLRNVAIQSEDQSEILVREWYDTHPQYLPSSFSPYKYQLEIFYISFIPRFLQLDAVISDQMNTMNNIRSKHEKFIQSWALVSPGLSLTLAANHLSGGSATQHDIYINKVNTFEKEWRDSLIPQIMSIQGLRMKNLDTLPTFNGTFIEDSSSLLTLLLGQLIVVFSLFILLFRYRNLLSHP